MKPNINHLPESGATAEQLLMQLRTSLSREANWKGGQVFGYVYHAGEAASEVSESYFRAFMHESTLNPTTFPSLHRFQREVVKMAAGLMNGGRQVAGTMTSGGTESIFLALFAAREEALEQGKTTGPFEVILPETIHPAFLKACKYLMIKEVIVPVGSDRRADPSAMERAITHNTILLACSAPSYPYGLVDPVEELGRIAQKYHLMLHVDACLGGFILPFMEQLGEPVPPFDFRVPGITSLSLDAHKYGYAPKGNSILLYRRRALRKKQFYVYADWPGGIYASVSFMGTRSGGPAAGCWAMMKSMGKQGYRELAREAMETTRKLASGIAAIKGLELLHDPVFPIIAFTSPGQNIHRIGDAMSARGWHLDRLQFPDALHMVITRSHVSTVNPFLHELQEVVRECSLPDRQVHSTTRIAGAVRGIMRLFPEALAERVLRRAGASMGAPAGGRGSRQAAMYGLSATLENRKDMKRFVLNLLDGMF